MAAVTICRSSECKLTCLTRREVSQQQDGLRSRDRFTAGCTGELGADASPTS